MSPAVDYALKSKAVQRHHAVSRRAAIAYRLEVGDRGGVEVARQAVIARHAYGALQRGGLAFAAAEIADGLELPYVADFVVAVCVAVDDELVGIVRGGIVGVRQPVAVAVGVGAPGQARAGRVADLAGSLRRIADGLRQHAVVAGDMVAVIELGRSRRPAGRTSLLGARGRSGGGRRPFLRALPYLPRRQVARLAGVIGGDVLEILVRLAEHRSAHERVRAPAVAVFLQRKVKVALVLPADLRIDRRRTVTVLPMTGEALPGQALAPLDVTLRPRRSGTARRQE